MLVYHEHPLEIALNRLMQALLYLVAVLSQTTTMKTTAKTAAKQMRQLLI